MIYAKKINKKSYDACPNLIYRALQRRAAELQLDTVKHYYNYQKVVVLSFKKLVVIENVENGHRVSKVDIVGWSIKVNFRRLC